MIELTEVATQPVKNTFQLCAANDVMDQMEPTEVTTMYDEPASRDASVDVDGVNAAAESEVVELPVGTTIAKDITKRVHYRDRVYSVEALQQRLLREIERLEWQLDQVARSPMGNRQILANTYQDMIEKRRELFDSLG